MFHTLSAMLGSGAMAFGTDDVCGLKGCPLMFCYISRKCVVLWSEP